MFVQYIKRNTALKKFSKFFVSGFSSFLIDSIALSFFTFSIFGGTNPVFLNSISIPKVLSSIIGLTTNFILNRSWVFRTTDKSLLRSQIIKFTCFSILNVLFGSIIYNVYLEIVRDLGSIVGLSSTDLAKLDVLLTNLITESTKMIVSFIAYKYFVFNNSNGKLTSTTTTSN
jgi:putative flippase GtrA